MKKIIRTPTCHQAFPALVQCKARKKKSLKSTRDEALMNPPLEWHNGKPVKSLGRETCPFHTYWLPQLRYFINKKNHPPLGLSSSGTTCVEANEAKSTRGEALVTPAAWVAPREASDVTKKRAVSFPTHADPPLSVYLDSITWTEKKKQIKIGYTVGSMSIGRTKVYCK